MMRPSALILYVALGGSLPLIGCARGFGRRLLMQGRTAADEWEASTRQGILESATIEAGRESQESHPLRTQDWTLQASTFTQASVVQKVLMNEVYRLLAIRYSSWVLHGYETKLPYTHHCCRVATTAVARTNRLQRHL